MRFLEILRSHRDSSTRRSRQQLALAGLVALVVLGLAGFSMSACTAETPGPTESPRTGNPSKTAHAIHVFAKTPDGKSVQLNFGPGTESTFSPEAIPTTFPTGLPVGPGVADASPLQSPATIESPGVDPWSTAWALVWRAAGQCGIWTYSNNAFPVPPWNGNLDGLGTWYVYQQGITDCADRLQIEQNLVCVADKLAEIADAVGTTVWPAYPGSPGDTTIGLGSVDGGALEKLAFAEWDIPPQADADRFIVRDLAIHTLAMIPPIDAYTDIAFPTPVPKKLTCSQVFAWFSNPGNVGASCISTAMSVPLFGVSSPSGFTPSFPPSTVPICDSSHNNVAPIAQSALDIDAQILRSGGRLLHDLIRRDVYIARADARNPSAFA